MKIIYKFKYNVHSGLLTFDLKYMMYITILL